MYDAVESEYDDEIRFIRTLGARARTTAPSRYVCVCAYIYMRVRRARVCTHTHTHDGEQMADTGLFVPAATIVVTDATVAFCPQLPNVRRQRLAPFIHPLFRARSF